MNIPRILNTDSYYPSTDLNALQYFPEVNAVLHPMGELSQTSSHPTNSNPDSPPIRDISPTATRLDGPKIPRHFSSEL